MKNLIFSAIAFFAFKCSAFAQPVGGIWMGSRSATGEAKAVHAAINTAFEALNARDFDKCWAVYSDEAASIEPNGKMIVGKLALKNALTDLMKFAEYEEVAVRDVQVRLLGPGVAIATMEAETSIKINGDQVGGKFRVSSTLRKMKGAWKIEFEQVTSQPHPESEKTGISYPTAIRYRS